jgi:hypothetical protein
MPAVWRRPLVYAWFAVWALTASRSAAAEPLPANAAGATVEQKLTSRSRPESAPLSAPPAEHPLSSVITYARGEQEYLRNTLRDFSCRLVKRERIEGFLQDYVYINMWVREEGRQGNRVTQPMSIYLEFLGPQKVAGRRVLFIEGENDGKMMVRNGGKHFDYVTVNIAPDSDSAREESLVPITQSGFNRVLAQMIDVLERHRKADPSGTNTQVKRIAGAKINKRPASVIHIVHPQKQAGLEFHEANVFVDDELRVPVRVDFSLWPSRANQKPPLAAEYTYTELQLNPNLPDSTFSRARVKSSR